MSGTGRLAEKWGLTGEVSEEHFTRLAEGQHPDTGEQLVRHQTAARIRKRSGETVKAMEHRAGWDATFSAPKSVSLRRWWAAMSECGRRTARASVLRSMRWSGTSRRGSAGTSGGDHRQMGRRQIRTRQRPPGGRLRRAATSHARGLLQPHGDRRTERRVRATAGAVSHAAVCDGGVSLGAGAASEGAGLRDRARARAGSRKSRATPRSIWKRRARAASRSKSIWPSRASRARRRRRSRRTGRAMPSSPLAGRDAAAASGDGRGLRQSARA